MSKQPDPAVVGLIGQQVIIRTVTHYHVGLVVGATRGFVTLEQASWVADTGRWGEALATGRLNETELFPSPVLVSLSAVIDITAWPHPLPTSSK